MQIPLFDKDKKTMEAPHVVILGAGASKATCPYADKNGYKIPLMNDLVNTLHLESLLEEYHLLEFRNDFEALYSKISEDGNLEHLKGHLNQAIYDYFSKLELPEEPTLYDYLILSLKEKDIIATFNWDPFLLQAYMRNRKVGNLPKLAFLHGNVFLGACFEDKVLGYMGYHCPACNKPFSPVDLLFPVAKKDYTKNPVIKDEWDKLVANLKHAYFLTIFGYSAPQSDLDAIDLMKKAWLTNESRELGQIEIIDIKSRDIITKNWEPFTVRNHYGVVGSLKESWLWQYPRESCEALFDATLQMNPIEPHPYFTSSNLEEIQEFAKNIKIRDLKI
jgi:hypothetical protein